jgi:acetyl/propionyl-CoA carboxylase alpha subunit
MPAGPGVRVDTHIEAGERVPADYDNLIAKLMVHAHDRDAAIDRLRRALDETEIGGVQTTLPFHRFVAQSEAFRAGVLATGWVDQYWDGDAARSEALGKALLAVGLASIAEEPVVAGHGATTAGDGRATSPPARNGWRRGGRGQGVDRWPS